MTMEPSLYLNNLRKKKTNFKIIMCLFSMFTKCQLATNAGTLCDILKKKNTSYLLSLQIKKKKNAKLK